MQELIEQDGDFEPITAEWMAQINEWRDNHPFYSPGVATENGTISPEGALDLLSDMLDQNNSIVTTEVGQHQMWAGAAYRARYSAHVPLQWWSWHDGLWLPRSYWR